MSLIKCRAIVIGTINFSESSVVLKCFTDVHGLQSFMVNGVRSKKGTIRNSQLQPLTLLELEMYHQENKNLKRIKELKCFPVLRNIHFDRIKSSIGIFIAELLNKSIREENHSDIPLFEFIFHSIQILDLENVNTANFPVYFMLQLSRYLGFFPKGIFAPDTNSFDLKEGNFERHDERNQFGIEPDLSEKISQLLRSDYKELAIVSATSKQRLQLIECLAVFYAIHLHGFGEMKSHKVLSEVIS